MRVTRTTYMQCAKMNRAQCGVVVDGYLKYIYSLNGQTTDWVFVFLYISPAAAACHHSHYSTHRQ